MNTWARHAARLVALAVCAGCGTGTIGPMSNPDVDGDPFRSGTSSPDGSAGPDAGAPFVPPDPDQPLFTHASVGTRCVDGVSSEWLVLSRDPVDCAAHADFLQPDSDAFLRVPLSSTPEGAMTARVPFCPPQSGCADRDVTIDVSSFDSDGGLRGTWLADLGAQSVGGDVDATRCGYEPLDNPARSIRLSEVIVNQGVAIPLARDGAVVSTANRSAPIVAGRDAVFQIAVTPESNWQPRQIVVEVQLDGVAVADTQAMVNAASNSSNPEAMIQVPVAGSQLTEGAAFSVGLFETASCVDQAGGVSAPRVPASGTAPLGAESLSGPFRIVLVPIRWNTDGSGRLPDLSPGVVQEFADGVAALYPVTGVDVSVRSQPLEYSGALDAGGNGWSQLLNECLSLRSSDNGPDEVYYYCLFQPTPDVRDFCSGGCVAGIGPVPSASDTYRRAAIGIGFNGSGVDTFLHEIGHALGRPHAPCGGASGADPGYPYDDAEIGVWGYDLTNDSHISPDYRDLMSYCGPNWISDYNYDLLFDRIASVYGRQFALKSGVAPLASVSYRTVVVDADMTLSWGRDAILRTAPEGQPVTAEFLDTSGQVVARVPAAYQSVTHVAGGMLLFEDVETTASTVRIEGFGTLAF